MSALPHHFISIVLPHSPGSAWLSAPFVAGFGVVRTEFRVQDARKCRRLRRLHTYIGTHKWNVTKLQMIARQTPDYFIHLNTISP